jgi:putative adhesin
MSTFDTPQPITAVVEVAAGSVRLVASDRLDTVVEVRPRDPHRTADVRIAEQTRVDFTNGTLTVSAGRRFIHLGRGGAVSIDIGLPSGSRLRASSASAEIHADGEFADCRLASASGDLLVDSIDGDVKVDTASGEITVQNANGSVAISTASGGATIGRLDGGVTFRTASGGLVVGRLHGSVNAQTASGDVTVACAVTGDVSVQTSSGNVEIGIAEGTAAQLDLQTHSGAVRNALAPSDGPAEGDETLIVKVRTASGDVDVRRSATEAADLS